MIKGLLSSITLMSTAVPTAAGNFKADVVTVGEKITVKMPSAESYFEGYVKWLANEDGNSSWVGKPITVWVNGADTPVAAHGDMFKGIRDYAGGVDKFYEEQIAANFKPNNLSYKDLNFASAVWIVKDGEDNKGFVSTKMEQYSVGTTYDIGIATKGKYNLIMGYFAATSLSLSSTANLNDISYEGAIARIYEGKENSVNFDINKLLETSKEDTSTTAGSAWSLDIDGPGPFDPVDPGHLIPGSTYDGLARQILVELNSQYHESVFGVRLDTNRHSVTDGGGGFGFEAIPYLSTKSLVDVTKVPGGSNAWPIILFILGGAAVLAPFATNEINKFRLKKGGNN